MSIGKITPSLIDTKLLKEMTKFNKMPKEIFIKSPLAEEVDYVCAKIIEFLRLYWMYIIGILCVSLYAYYCHIQYKNTKNIKKEVTEQFIDPGEYVRVNNGIQILQRPIPEAKLNPINEEIRNIYLSKLNPPACAIGPSTVTRLPRLKYNNSKHIEDRLINVYGQPMGEDTYCGVIDPDYKYGSNGRNEYINDIRLGPNIRRGHNSLSHKPMVMQYDGPIYRTPLDNSDRLYSEDSVDYGY